MCDIDLERKREVKVARELLTARARDVLGDPRMALAWLVNELSGLGITLKATEVVTTGTCLVPLPIAPGIEVRADFGALGKVSARIV